MLDTIKEFWSDLLGLSASASTITTSQICWRTGVIFIVAIMLLRPSGRRTFASSSALETIVKFMLGGLLSRAIAAAGPFGATIAAAMTLVVLHRVIAYATYFIPPLGRLIKGEPSILAEGDHIHYDELRLASFSEQAMRAAVRGAANLDDLSEAKIVRLEHDGSISVVKKEKE
ncbi:MAG: YetF domain-containing protein [Hymenobacter sp.]